MCNSRVNYKPCFCGKICAYAEETLNDTMCRGNVVCVATDFANDDDSVHACKYHRQEIADRINGSNDVFLIEHPEHPKTVKELSEITRAKTDEMIEAYYGV